MKDRSSAESPNLSARGREARAGRDRRLAEALRANLRRRKEQARGRGESGRETDPKENAGHDEGGADRMGRAAGEG